MNRLGAALLVTLGAAALTTHAAGEDKKGAAGDTRIFELRIYHAAPGKMDALNARFREHTNKLFVKHGMTLIGYWNPTDPEEAQRKLIYILAFPSKEAADRSWAGFRSDPEWKKVREASEANGKLVERVESVFMKATDYSPLK